MAGEHSPTRQVSVHPQAQVSVHPQGRCAFTHKQVPELQALQCTERVRGIAVQALPRKAYSAEQLKAHCVGQLNRPIALGS